MFFLLTLVASAAQAKPKIANAWATGGTIAGAQATQADAGYKSGSFSVNDLIKAVPQLKNVAELSGEQTANIGSQTMNHEVWLKLADRVQRGAQSERRGRRGHYPRHGHDGGDRLFPQPRREERKAGVLVCSMRPATGISADGPMNLYNGVVLAGSPGQGPWPAGHDQRHHPLRARAAKDAHDLPARLRVPEPRRRRHDEHRPVVLLFAKRTRHTTKSEFSVNGLKTTDLPRVEIVYSHADLGGETVDSWSARA